MCIERVTIVRASKTEKASEEELKPVEDSDKLIVDRTTLVFTALIMNKKWKKKKADAMIQNLNYKASISQ